MTTLWRVHLNATPRSGVDQRHFCLREKGVVGIGWPVPDNEATLDFEEYCRRAERHYPNDKGWRQAVNGIKGMVKGDLVWCRDWNGVYYLGRITDGSWHYEGGDEFRAADTVNVRSCQWVRVGTEGAVPGDIVNRFIRGQTVQQVPRQLLLAFSMQLFNDATDTERYEIPVAHGDVWSFLSSDGCEDVLAVYLQERGYRIVASTCKKSTPKYEYELIDRDTGSRAVAQVKKGEPLRPVDYTNVAERVFLFSTAGEYPGAKYPQIICLDPPDLERFMRDNLVMMPPKIRTWIKLHDELVAGE